MASNDLCPHLFQSLAESIVLLKEQSEEFRILLEHARREFQLKQELQIQLMEKYTVQHLGSAKAVWDALNEILVQEEAELEEETPVDEQDSLHIEIRSNNSKFPNAETAKHCEDPAEKENAAQKENVPLVTQTEHATEMYTTNTIVSHTKEDESAGPKEISSIMKSRQRMTRKVADLRKGV